MTPMDEKNKKNETYPKGMSTDLSPVLPYLVESGWLVGILPQNVFFQKGGKYLWVGHLGCKSIITPFHTEMKVQRDKVRQTCPGALSKEVAELAFKSGFWPVLIHYLLPLALDLI